MFIDRLQNVSNVIYIVVNQKKKYFSPHNCNLVARQTWLIINIAIIFRFIFGSIIKIKQKESCKTIWTIWVSSKVRYNMQSNQIYVLTQSTSLYRKWNFLFPVKFQHTKSDWISETSYVDSSRLFNDIAKKLSALYDNRSCCRRCN